ncbi:MAG: hypothetical protein RJB38_1999 [Pseudomonadota bacterium]|jgi:hypothetical protein
MSSENWSEWEDLHGKPPQQTPEEAPRTPHSPEKDALFESLASEPTPALASENLGGDFFHPEPSALAPAGEHPLEGEPMASSATEESQDFGSAPEAPSPSVLRSLHTKPSASVSSSRPFHLWITGELKPYEKERLIELLEREDFGVRTVDLEIQFEAKKVLLPRISEFAAVLVTQALRGASVELSLLPSDASPSPSLEDSADATNTSGLATPWKNETTVSNALDQHPAHLLPLTPHSAIPGQESALPLDLLFATALLREPEWKAETSDAFAELVESLKQELRFKAHIRGADALVQFEAQVLSNPWISDRECRIQAKALAVKFQS